MLSSSLVLILAASLTLALNDGLARTPPMGWNPYNAFRCDTTEQQYHTAAQSLINLGLDSLGYHYINLDCGWQGKSRNSSGGFTWDTTILPSGVSALSSFVHELGLKFGVYSDGGVFACDFVGGTAHYIGSLDHENSDAASFASWGADYLKYDNCYSVSSTDFVDFNPPIQIQPHYTTMQKALVATGRPIVFSICEWGVQDPARWPASAIGHLWRISNDIGASWDDLFRIINQLVPITEFAGPGGWNDLDLLEIGNSGLTLAEQLTHFVFWAAAKSPLFISTDLTKISTEALTILKNTRIIALNQDSLGESISFKRRYTNDHDVWAGPLFDGSTVVVVINWQNSARSLTLDLADVGFTSATADDLLSGISLGRLSNSYTSNVDAHGVIVLKLSNSTLISPPSFTVYNAAAPENTLAGGASVRVISSSISVVGFIGNGGTLTFNNIDGGESGTKLVSVDYINADFVFENTVCSNCRNSFFSVNGGDPVQVQMPISGQSWDDDIFSGFVVSLSGFRAGGNNTIEISNPNAFTPDFYRIRVAV